MTRSIAIPLGALALFLVLVMFVTYLLIRPTQPDCSARVPKMAQHPDCKK